MASIINGLFAGRTGIASNGAAIAVVGDNIANSSTVGFKSSRTEFSDLIAGGGAGAGGVVGSGSLASGISTIFEQGTMEQTSRPLDLAVDGNGLFILEDKAGQRFYTRAGNFKVDAEGFIVSQSGLKVLGYSGELTAGVLNQLSINNISQSNVSTTEMSLSGNLQSSLSNATIPTVAAWNAGADATDPTLADISNAASFVTQVPVFDTLGAQHGINLAFYKTAANSWNVRAYIRAGDVDPALPVGGESADEPRELGFTTMTFNGSGVQSPPTPVWTVAIPNWTNGATAGSIDFDLTGFTQYANLSALTQQLQDGKGVGQVSTLSVGPDGSLFAILSNGQNSVLGSLALANFANVEGLTRVGGTLLQQSNVSGEPVIGTAQNGPFGTIKSGSLELSTADIASEFVKLIQLQRGFQASSRIVTTINQLLNEIIQLA